MRRTLFLCVSALALLSGVCSSGTPPFIRAAYAADASVKDAAIINVRVGAHDDFDRIVFDWPRAVPYHVKREGAKVDIVFEAAANPKYGKAALANLRRISGFSAELNDKGNLVIGFTVAVDAELHDFVSGTSIAIDVKDATRSPQHEERSTPKTPAPEQAVKPILPKEETVRQPPVSVVEKLADAGKKTSVDEKPIPLLDNQQANPAKPVVAAVLPKSPDAPQPAAVPAEGDASKHTAASSPVTVPATLAATKLNDALSKPTQTTTIDLAGDTPVEVMAIDPKIPTRVAIYQRAGYAYLIFEKMITLSLAELTKDLDPPKVSANSLTMEKASGFRFAVPSDADIQAVAEGTQWKIYLSKKKQDIPVSMGLVAQPNFALGARYLLPLPDAPMPIRFTDPVVGDDLIVIPLLQNQSASLTRRMAEFQLVPAAIGVVIKPMADNIVARAVSDGIEITAEGGLHLSSPNDTGSVKQSEQMEKSKEEGESLFDFSMWQGKKGESFSQTRQRLQQTIVDVPSAERNRARLELARFYFSHAYGPEAVGLLNMLVQDLPDLMSHRDFLALLGASEVVSYHPDEGLQHLNSPLFDGQPEIDLWKAVAAAQLRHWQDAEEKFAITQSILYGYPEPFRSRFFVLAIESALSSGKDHEAADWLDKFESSQPDESTKPAITYVRAALHAKAGRVQAASSGWKDVTEMNDRLYKIRAELALVDLGVSTNSITPAQATERLEAMRFGWRGDDLEVDILHRLGQFYVQAKNIKAGLGTLAQAVRLYPNSPITPQIKTEMSGVFHDVYLGELGKNLSPLDALAIYQQYSNLMPAGAEGDQVMLNLAERLVAIDLLDQASGLLETLVKERLQGEQKGKISARLAAIRLLDHKPEDALEALNAGQVEGLSAVVASERAVLRAKALSELHKDDDALQLLANDNSKTARILRADINMHGQHWSEAAKTLLELVGPPPPSGELLKPEQVEWIIDAAISYSMAGDQDGLDKLAMTYGAGMAGTDEHDTFRLLTKPESDAAIRDVSAVQSRMADVDMFQSFLNTYRKAQEPTAAPSQAEKKP